MFGEDKTPSAWRPTRRMIFTVENVADANNATEICCILFYAIATLQAIIFGYSFVILDTPLTYLFDPALQLLLAWFIHHKKSRTAASLLGAGTVYIFLLTLGNKIEMQIVPGGMGGKNIIIATFALYGIYKGLQGTFRFHQLSNSITIGKNVWKMIGLLLLYNILVFGILLMVALYLKLQQPEFWGSGDEAFSNHAFGGVVMLCMLLVSAGTVFRILPWTKNKPLVARTASSIVSKEPS